MIVWTLQIAGCAKKLNAFLFRMKSAYQDGYARINRRLPTMRLSHPINDDGSIVTEQLMPA